MKKISRRGFLKGAAATAGLMAASAIPLPSSARGAQTGELATLLDLSKCIGCGACVEACREVNAEKFPEPKKPFPKMVPEKRVKVADFSGKRDVTDRLTPYNWLYIQSATVVHDGSEVAVNIPRRCMHCVNPPCADLCPFGAARKLPNGITRIHPEVCLGGAKCKDVCPWGIPERQTGVGLYLSLMPAYAGNGVLYKCDRCYNRLEKGENPACIDICPEGVQEIGPREEMIKKAKELALQMKGYVYGLDENGGTNTFYVSPVPFDLLNKAVEKGPGKPHLKKVEDAMGKSENMAKAMILAPIAGLAAGALAFARTVDRLAAPTEAAPKAPEKPETGKGEGRS